MNKFSVSKTPHFICKCLILSKVYCFGKKASWWGCFKGASSLLDLWSAGCVDDILDDVYILVDFFLVPESDESSDNVFNESSEDYEDKELDEISIYFCTI